MAAQTFTPGQWARLSKFLATKGEPVSPAARRVLNVIAMHEALSKRVPAAEELARQADVGANKLRYQLLPELESFRLITVTPGSGRRPTRYTTRPEVVGPWMSGRLSLDSEPVASPIREATDAASVTEPGSYSRAGVLAAVVGEFDPAADAENATPETGAADAAPVTSEELEAIRAEIWAKDDLTVAEKAAEFARRQVAAMVGRSAAAPDPEELAKSREKARREQAAMRESIRRQAEAERLEHDVQQAVEVLRSGGIRVPPLVRERVEFWTRKGETVDGWRECAEKAAKAGMNRFDYVEPIIRSHLGLDYQPPTPHHPENVRSFDAYKFNDGLAVEDTGWVVESPEDPA